MNIKIKKQFPALNQKIDEKRLIYLDNACTALKSRTAINAVNSYYRDLGACAGGRSSHYLSWQTEELIELARNKVKDFIGANSDKEIIWTKNSTEGINLVAASFPFSQKRNEVIVSSLEHHSNLLPFYEQSKKRGFRLKTISPDKDGSLSMERLAKSISKKTALVAITQLSNVTGLVYPVSEIIELAHKQGAFVLVDDAQYVASHKEEAQKKNMDFLVFSGHKLGGPTGIGVLYVKSSLLEKMKSFNVGGGVVQSVVVGRDKIKTTYLPDYRKFEAGIQNYAGIIGLAGAIDFLGRTGYQKITEHINFLGQYAYQKLEQIGGIRFLADYKHQKPGPLLTFYFSEKNLSLYDFNLFLNHEVKDYSVAVRCGHHCAQPAHGVMGNSPISMRISFFIYNSKKEIDIFTDALNEFLSLNLNK